MSTFTDKPWEKALTTQEIVDNASNWSLASDSGLLKHLEAFSENLVYRASETNDNLNSLVDNLNAVTIKLDIAKNEFLSLHNTQFIESRVYEDDEVLGNDQKEEIEPKKQTEEELRDDIKNAVLSGLEVIDKYYDKVSVPASDSEDETEFASYVLRPKDPYLNRPLPYVIGTDEWHQKWHVGLEGSSDDDSEDEKISEKFSDSDSDDNLPITDRRDISNSNSGTDISTNDRPAATSTLIDTLGSSDSEDMDNSLPAKSPISNANFAQQLATKLGNMIEQNEEEPVINKRPIKKEPSKIADLFSDSPPPLDEIDDGMFVPKTKGMFSGGGGLFDDSDDENDPLWGPQITNNNIKSTEDKKQPNVINEDIFAPVKGKKESDLQGGLFDGENDSDEDIFASVAKNNTRKSILKPFSNLPAFVDEEPPEIVDFSKKKPVGGVSVLPKLGSLLPTRRKSSSDSSSDKDIIKSSDKSGGVANDRSIIEEKSDFGKVSLFDDDVPKDDDIFGTKSNLFADEQSTTKKKASIFDDTDIFEDNLFTNIGNKKFTSNLFDDVAEPSFKERPKTLNFFEDQDDIFATNSKTISEKDAGIFGTKSNLFGESSEDIFRPEEKEPPNLFAGENDLFGTPSDNSKLFGGALEASDLFGGTTAKLFEGGSNLSTKKEINLFEDSSSDEDIFASKSITKSVKKESNVNPLGDEYLSPEITKEILAAFKAMDEGKALPDRKNIEEDNSSKNNNSSEAGLSVKHEQIEERAEKQEDDKTIEEMSKTVKPMIKKKPMNDGINLASPEKPEVTKRTLKKDENSSPEKPKVIQRNIKDKNEKSSAEKPDVIKRNVKDDSGAELIKNKLSSSSGTNNVQNAEGLVDEIKIEQNTVDHSVPDLDEDIFRPVNIVEDKFRRMRSADEPNLEPQNEQPTNIPTSKSIPNINLFDNVPPPVDDYWDTHSDSNLFDDDDMIFETIPNLGAKKLSLFDDEPPEIEPLTVKSSLFGVDNFLDDFPAKTSAPPLFDDASAFKDVESEISSTDKNVGLINKSIDNKTIIDDAIFVKPDVLTKPPVMERLLVFQKVEEKKVEEKSSNVNENIRQVEEGLQASTKTDSSIKIPGKLKHNLNINVSALMPGNALPKKRDALTKKSHSLDSEKSDNAESSSATETSNSYKDISTIDVNLNEDCNREVETLHSVTKSRAKIPIKRRPSTRRARQESIRKSIISNSLDNDESANNNHPNEPDNDAGNLGGLSNASLDNYLPSSSLLEDNKTDNNVQTLINDSINKNAPIIDNSILEQNDSNFRNIDSSTKNDSSFTNTISIHSKGKTTEHSFSAENDQNALISKNAQRPGILKKTSKLPVSQENTPKVIGNVIKDDLIKAKNEKSIMNDGLKTNVVSNIFNDDDDSDSDIFASSKKPNKVLNRNVSDDLFGAQTADLFSGNKQLTNDDLFENIPQSKKLIGVGDKVTKNVLQRDDKIVSDEDDIFEHVKNAKNPQNIFDDADDDLFSSKKIVAKKDHVKDTKKSIFDDDDEDLFSSKKLPSTRSKLVKQGTLFEDVDDGDDIFASGSQKNTKITKTASVIKTTERNPDKGKKSLRKSEDNEVIDDPLDALRK